MTGDYEFDQHVKTKDGREYRVLWTAKRVDGKQTRLRVKPVSGSNAASRVIKVADIHAVV